jgi:hypothetical protein
LISLTLVLLAVNGIATPGIEIAGEEACPESPEVLARLGELVAIDSPMIRNLHVHLSRRNDRLNIEIDDSHGTRLVERSVPQTGSCADMAHAVALVVASWAGEIGGVPVDPIPPTMPGADRAALPSTRPSARLELASSKQPVTPSANQVVVPAAGQPGKGVVLGSTQRVLGVVAGSVGVASLVAGVIYAFAAESNDRAAENACLMGSCGVAAGAQIARAESDARKSDVFLGLGTGLVAAGAIVYLLAPSVPDGRKISAVRVTPVAATRSAGLVAIGRF